MRAFVKVLEKLAKDEKVREKAKEVAKEGAVFLFKAALEVYFGSKGGGNNSQQKGGGCFFTGSSRGASAGSSARNDLNS